MDVLAEHTVYEAGEFEIIEMDMDEEDDEEAEAEDEENKAGETSKKKEVKAEKMEKAVLGVGTEVAVEEAAAENIEKNPN